LVKKTRGPWEGKQPLVSEANILLSTNMPEVLKSLITGNYPILKIKKSDNTIDISMAFLGIRHV
jgi:hypothetical protein